MKQAIKAKGLLQRKIQKSRRKQCQVYDYTIPITFAGFIAIRYEIPAPITHPPQPNNPNKTEIVARDINLLKLVGNKPHRVKGLAETVSALEVDHTIFERESLDYKDQPLYR